MREIEILKELHDEILQERRKNHLGYLTIDYVRINSYKWFLNNYPTISIHKIDEYTKTVTEIINMNIGD